MEVSEIFNMPPQLSKEQVQQDIMPDYMGPNNYYDDGAGT